MSLAIVPINPLDPVPPELQRIDGINKLKRAIQKEISSPNVNEKSSNLPHLLSILKCIQQVSLKQQDPSSNTECTGSSSVSQQVPSAVLKPFTYSRGKTGRLIVDIVSSDGDFWYKVSARNPKALCLLAAGGGGFGQKSIIDHVCDYLECAKQNPCLFKAPKVPGLNSDQLCNSNCLLIQIQTQSLICRLQSSLQAELVNPSPTNWNPSAPESLAKGFQTMTSEFIQESKSSRTQAALKN